MGGMLLIELILMFKRYKTSVNKFLKNFIKRGLLCSGHSLYLLDHVLWQIDVNEVLGLTMKAIWKDEKRRTEEITVTVIETETKRFRKITLDEIKKVWTT